MNYDCIFYVMVLSFQFFFAKVKEERLTLCLGFCFREEEDCSLPKLLSASISSSRLGVECDSEGFRLLVLFGRS